ncbi:ADA HAT complex component 1 [Madurella fahalii]|uniref:ADA HAT complex component 1 n=1 Tax=Madurella fahalii TaxID=1157608 RepID=A0ABQ0FXR5_9PEZI
MAKPAIPSADDISDSEFQSYLERYPACIEAISESKGAKPGQKTLASLDQYRYGKAIDTFGSGDTNVSMALDDVKTLVEWKLRHGKFRPTLMKLVSSNEPGFVKDTLQKAIKHYRQKSDVSGTLDILTQLKGIGPATASLLLAVHDAENVIFFADEAFYWLCCHGSKAPIKYNQKEYAELNERAKALAKRLHVKAVDVERVAFVVMRESAEEMPAGASKSTTKSSANSTGKKQPAKRKILGDSTDTEMRPRRSKRGKQT